MEDLFGSDSESVGDKSEAVEKQSKQLCTIDCPQYPHIPRDGKVRVSLLSGRSSELFLTLDHLLQMYFTRLATVFGMQQTPFHASSYTGADQEPVVKVDEFGQTKVRPAPVHMIRWRYTRNNKGDRIRQSNAKLVRWSDGALCLYVGDERFTVTESDLRVPYHLCTKSEGGLQSQGEISSRLMFQPTSKAAATRGAQKAAAADTLVVLTADAQMDYKARAEAREESERLNQGTTTSKKRRGGSVTRLDADFLEEGTDLGATKAHFRSKSALVREGSSSKRLMEIKAGRKKKKLRDDEEEDEGSDDSFIASEGEVSEESFTDEE